MVVKLDMERAYDRMIWSFIGRVLSLFGFGEQFVKLILGCISGSAFSILINGSPSEWFTSTVGLRQGDPLSPYLFIIGAEVFTRLINQSIARNTLQGFKVEEGLHFAQLAYADDCLLILAASVRNVKEMSNILEYYCRVSGQSVNAHKSNIFFGRSVDSRLRRAICRVSKIKEGRLPFRYLGVKVGMCKLPLAEFQDVIDRVRKRLSGWKASSLSFAGRLTLVHAVLQALPTYLMANGWVPKAIIKRLEILCRTFLWKGKGDGRYLAQVPWSVIGRSKADGGLGLRDLGIFRQALITKLWLRVNAGRHSFLAQIWRCKYRAFLAPARSSAPPLSSAVWREVVACRGSFDDEVRWQVRSGRMVSVADAVWVGNRPLAQADVLPGRWGEVQQLVVADLLDPTCHWNPQRIRELFVPAMCDLILQVPVSSSPGDDVQLWRGSPLGQVAVRDIYQWWVDQDPNQAAKIDYSWLWALGGAYKVLVWLWRLLNDGIATNHFLTRRGLLDSSRCPRCEACAETVAHLLVGCEVSRSLWSEIGSRFGLQLQFSCYEEWLQAISLPGGSVPSRSKAQLALLYGAWWIWLSRNERKFSDVVPNVRRLADTVVHQVEERLHVPSLVLDLEDRRDSLSQSSLWRPPDVGEVKCNFDGCWFESSDDGGAGFVLRGSDGMVILAAGFYLVSTSPLDSEVRSLWEAAKELASNYRGSKVWLEGDSSVVVDWLSCSSVRDIHPLVADARLVL